MAKSGSNKGVFRIIGGNWKGKKVHFIATEGLRPTTDRVRETVFNWLMFDVRDALCLDCFAGSGSLGMEALSRGASHVDFFEMNRAAAKKLQANVNELHGASATIHQTDAIKRLQFSPDQPYDIVFIDPPFRKELLPKTIDALVDNGWLKDGTLVYLEREKELMSVALPDSWQQTKHKQAGQVDYSLFEVGSVS